MFGGPKIATSQLYMSDSSTKVILKPSTGSSWRLFISNISAFWELATWCPCWAIFHNELIHVNMSAIHHSRDEGIKGTVYPTSAAVAHWEKLTLVSRFNGTETGYESRRRGFMWPERLRMRRPPLLGSTRSSWYSRPVRAAVVKPNIFRQTFEIRVRIPPNYCLNLIVDCFHLFQNSFSCHIDMTFFVITTCV